MIDSITRSCRFGAAAQSAAKAESADVSFGEILAEAAEIDLLASAPPAWVTESGFRDDAIKIALDYKKNTLGIDEETEPTHTLTPEQEAWLCSRHDFSTMRQYIRYNFVTDEGNVQVATECTAEYSNFVADLVYLGVYTRDELVLNVAPIDTRPGSHSALSDYLYDPDRLNGGLFESTRALVSLLENMYDYYYERSNDPTRAVAGDSEFAALILDRYLPFQKEFFEMIDRLIQKDRETEPLPWERVIPAVTDVSERLREDFGEAFA